MQIQISGGGSLPPSADSGLRTPDSGLPLIPSPDHGLRTSDSGPAEGSSAAIKQRVMAARALQYARHGGEIPNSSLSSKQVKAYCQLDEAGQALLTRAVERLGLSARAYERIRKVARTIADLDASEDINVPHLAEAIQYRSGEERLRG